MKNEGTITLQPPSSGRAYVDEHELVVSKANDAGAKIKFTANDSGFVVVIPRADTLFNTSDKTLHIRISTSTPVETPTINSNVTVGDKYEYHVFCEEERDWAHKPGSSPPKIIIVD